MFETIFITVFASTGFWAFLTAIIQHTREKNNGESRMLRGLAHDRICYLGSCYIPYKELGGNGTAEKVMNEVEKLEFRKN